jgi:FAD/FMN-containing dehydrogenase
MPLYLSLSLSLSQANLLIAHVFFFFFRPTHVYAYGHAHSLAHSLTPQLWSLRENITSALTARGLVYKYDVSLPLEHMYKPVDTLRDRIKGIVWRKNHNREGEQSAEPIVTGYGHLGDSNLHLNCVWPGQYGMHESLRDVIEPWVYEETAKVKGSISAEHGVGVMKAKHLHHSKPPLAISMMRMLKQQFDPHNILNPGKVLLPK